MIKYVPCCDICQSELEVKVKPTAIGDVKYVKSYKTKVIDTSMIFDHLCKTCQLQIDNALLQAKLEILSSNGGK